MKGSIQTDKLLEAADPDVVKAVHANVRSARNDALWDNIKGGVIVAILLALLKAVQFATADTGPQNPHPPTPPPVELLEGHDPQRTCPRPANPIRGMTDGLIDT